MTSNDVSLPAERLAERIHLIRNRRVMLSTDLAQLYEVEVKVLNQAVKRNIDRFPGDFMFQLTWDEMAGLRSQIVTLDNISPHKSSQRGYHPKYPPYAFTQEGVAMLSSVLRSRRAVQVNIQIMRAFVRQREMLAAHHDLTARLDALEKKYDQTFKVVFDALRSLIESPEPKRGSIGFRP